MTSLERFHFITAKGADGWGVSFIRDGEAIGHWTAEEAAAKAAELAKAAALAKRPGKLLPA